MNAVFKSVRRMLHEISHEAALAVMLLIPLLVAAMSKLGVPAVEQWLCEYYQMCIVLYRYYPLIDLLILVVPAVAMTYLMAMVMLDELDQKTARYLCITPLGKQGYLMARFLVPHLAGAVYTMVLGSIFMLSDIVVVKLIIVSLLSAGSGIAVSLFIVAYSGNKVEGLALVKLSGLFILGIAVPYFISGPFKYVFAVLPGFWLAQYRISSNYLYVLVCAIVTAVWIWLFYRRFERKII